MAVGLNKPKANVFRSYLYLDSEEVVNSLSALEGGDIEEVLTHIAEEGGGELGGSVGLGGVKGNAAKRKSRRVEEEIRRRRSEYSAASSLLRLLHEQEAIGTIEGEYNGAIHDELDEQMLIEFRATLRVHPLHQMINAGKAWASTAKTFGATAEEVRSVRETVGLMESLAQPASGERRMFLAFAETGPSQDRYRLVVPVQERYVRVAVDEFAGKVTFVAQVDRVLRDNEQLLALRLIRNTPPLAFERQGLLEALPDLLAAFGELGIHTNQDEFVLGAPSVVLKPICIYR